jgi:hypothetical protein
MVSKKELYKYTLKMQKMQAEQSENLKKRSIIIMWKCYKFIDQE